MNEKRYVKVCDGCMAVDIVNITGDIITVRITGMMKRD